MIDSKSVKPNHRKVNIDKKTKTGDRFFSQTVLAFLASLFSRANQFISDLARGFKHPWTTKLCLRINLSK